jgi:hypothetical protein
VLTGIEWDASRVSVAIYHSVCPLLVAYTLNIIVLFASAVIQVRDTRGE